MKRVIFHIPVFLFLALSTIGHSQYTINSEYGNLVDCDTLTSGIYIVWWDNNWDYSADAQALLDHMEAYRDVCLNDLELQDPPNPVDGYYYNVYLHRPDDLFPAWWSNGQGTDSNGYPYLTLPIGAHNDWVNVAHETFHVFQYSANSPGFAYAGDSQWYIEASANWFAARQNADVDEAFVEAESLVRLPHVALWLSYDNFPATYPQNWQRYVHQYALALLLYYLSEETTVPDEIITEGLYAGTSDLPQEYFFNQMGGAVFRGHFIDWAAHMTNHFDFLPANQIARFEQEWDTYADPADSYEYVAEFTDEGTNGWFSPDPWVTTAGWAYNTYKINNASADTYTFHMEGNEFGTNGSPSYFQGKVLVQNTTTGTSFYDLNMSNAQDGSFSIAVTPEDTTLYFIVASMPEVFTDVEQLYPYQIHISKGVLGIQDINKQPKYVLVENPASGSIQFQLNAAFAYSDITIEVYSVAGQKMFTHSATNPTESISIENGLDRGVYFLRIQDTEGIYTFKLLIE
ncbi:putative secreted protein (Por secretion system target) [Ulvibacter sp. MAR_2010_11]|uniref:T9SS type A sorting domain-containing protein n=1 Tax=Ulvibacter sp. MAR_2010_11 TaxID=1250229 RepID=UPI000C2BDECA|nr:T9SS type A sorting domain-containing protein [Ulvibacter sp. MAR_2010_11]PKA84403.1 putative secreted protein (Por secretion system target) [Ulvibacter sp. MAR_2010_11]